MACVTSNLELLLVRRLERAEQLLLREHVERALLLGDHRLGVRVVDTERVQLAERVAAPERHRDAPPGTVRPTPRRRAAVACVAPRGASR